MAGISRVIQDRGSRETAGKRIWATRCDWWFAYTETSREIVETYGFPRQRITVFHNAIDTSEIRRLVAQVDNRRLNRYGRN